MDTVGIRMPARRIREFSTFSVSSTLRHSPSARCASAESDMQIFWICSGKTLSPLRKVSPYGKVSRLILFCSVSF
jgi:hypothetical protein